MEETVFIKCEPPEWQSDEEESSTVEPNPPSFSDFMEVMKVEPVDIVPHLVIKEEPAVIGGVKQEIQDVKEETRIEECRVQEASPKGVESSTLSKKSKPAAKRTSYIEEDKPCHCSICGKTFTHGRFLKTHLVVHSQEKKTCQICKKEFLRQSTLERHVLLHFDVNRLACSICGKIFARGGNLKTHMFVHSLHQTSTTYGYLWAI